MFLESVPFLTQSNFFLHCFFQTYSSLYVPFISLALVNPFVALVCLYAQVLYLMCQYQCTPMLNTGSNQSTSLCALFESVPTALAYFVPGVLIEHGM